MTKADARAMQPGQTKAQWKFSAPQARVLTRAVAEVFIRDCLHPSMVEGAGFNKFVRIIEPRYVLPSRSYFTQVLCASFVVFQCSSLISF